MEVCGCGAHILVEKTVAKTIEKVGPSSTCFQCFISGTTNYTLRKVPEDDILASGELLEKRRINMYTHSPYVINLARVGDDSIVDRSKACLQSMVNTLHKIHPTRTGTVVHIGAKGTIENVCTQLNDMDAKVPILMENCAETSKLGRTLDELRKIVEGTDSRNIGICLDTCHCYAGGMCDFSDINQVDKLFEDISFTHNRKVIFHANDSLVPFNGRADRHSHIGYGHIWNINRPESIPALERYYELAKMNCMDIIFETPNEFDKTYEDTLYNNV